MKEQVQFEQPAQEYTLLDYLHEVEHVAGRIRRACRHRPTIGWALRKRQEGLREEVKEIAGKAQHHKRYPNLVAAGKDKQKGVTAVGRELMGFVWTIGVQLEPNTLPSEKETDNLMKPNGRATWKLSFGRLLFFGFFL